jgi:hypothetical protein
MNLTLKKLIKLVLDDKRILVIYLIVCTLIYPAYFTLFKLKKENLYKIDIMYNYTLPNSISSTLSDSFLNLLFDKISQGGFRKAGFYCEIKINEVYKSKIIECAEKNKESNFENFRKRIESLYEEHIDQLRRSIEQFPFAISDKSEVINYSKENLIYLEKEKKTKYLLKVSEQTRIYEFNNIHYIISFILIFFLNILRIVIKY